MEMGVSYSVVDMDPFIYEIPLKCSLCRTDIVGKYYRTNVNSKRVSRSDKIYCFCLFCKNDIQPLDVELIE